MACILIEDALLSFSFSLGPVPELTGQAMQSWSIQLSSIQLPHHINTSKTKLKKMLGLWREFQG